MSESGLSFRVGDDGTTVMARWHFGPERPQADTEAVRAMLSAAGFEGCLFDDDAIAAFLETTQTIEKDIERRIGERRDGHLVINITDDRLEARLTLERPHGGVAMTDADVRSGLALAGVVYGIAEDTLAAAVAAGVATNLSVARGTAPVHGADAFFTSLIENAQDRRPRVDEHGVTDYRDLGRIPGVTAGAPVMRRTPAITGRDGVDVTGKVLKARVGKNVAFAANLKGVTADPDDPNVLLASITGRPVQVANGMIVEPTIDLPQVDMASGNVDFDGSVTVLGDVMPRMRIRATGDVLVQGTVASADIDAGGQVVLQGGFQAALDDEDGADHTPRHEHRIRCGGDFRAKFVEYAHVESGADIVIDDHAMFSTLVASRHVVVGGAGATGQVIGGQITAVGKVTATKFGGRSGTKTLVHVGIDAKRRLHLEHLDSELAKYEAQHAEGPDVDRARAEAALLRLQATLADRACVAVGRQVYPGTELRINGKRWSSFDEHASCVFRVVNGEVELCAA